MQTGIGTTWYKQNQRGLYQNKVTSSITAIQRPGHWADICKMVYSPSGHDVFPIKIKITRTDLDNVAGWLMCWGKSVHLLSKRRKWEHILQTKDGRNYMSSVHQKPELLDYWLQLTTSHCRFFCDVGKRTSKTVSLLLGDGKLISVSQGFFTPSGPSIRPAKSISYLHQG